MSLDNYWTIRKTRELARDDRSERQYYKRIRALYQGSIEDITTMISEIYANYGENGKVTFQQMATADAKRRISRLEVLKADISKRLSQLNKERTKAAEETLTEDYKENYFRGVYDLQQAMGQGSPFQLIDDRAIKQVVGTKWLDGRNYSDRLWDDKNKLTHTLYTLIGQGIAQGLSYEALAQNLKLKMESSQSSAMRLIRTEMGYMRSRADKDSYEAAGIVNYQFVSTLDNRTSDICIDMDGKIFPMSEMEPGVNAPPMHPNCRSTTVPVIQITSFTESGEEKQVTLGGELRRARKTSGETYLVPADLTYKKWYDAYVLGKKPQEAQQPQYRGEKTRIYDGVEVDMAQLYQLTYDALNEAIQGESILTPDMLRFADKFGLLMSGLKHRVKGQDYIMDNAIANYLELVKKRGSSDSLLQSTVADLKSTMNGYTFVLDEEGFTDKFKQVVEGMKEAGYEISSIQNRFIEDEPFKGITTIMTTPEGTEFELQFHTSKSVDVRDYGNFELYEQFKAPGTSEERREEIMDEMIKNAEEVTIPEKIEEVVEEIPTIDFEEIVEVAQARIDEVTVSVTKEYDINKPIPLKLHLHEQGGRGFEGLEITTKYFEEWLEDPVKFVKTYLPDDTIDYYRASAIKQLVLHGIKHALKGAEYFYERNFLDVDPDDVKFRVRVEDFKKLQPGFRKMYQGWKERKIEEQKEIDQLAVAEEIKKGMTKDGIIRSSEPEDIQTNAALVLERSITLFQEERRRSGYEERRRDRIDYYDIKKGVTKMLDRGVDSNYVYAAFLKEQPKEGDNTVLYRGVGDGLQVVHLDQVIFAESRYGGHELIAKVLQNASEGKTTYGDNYGFKTHLRKPVTSYRGTLVEEAQAVPDIYKVTVKVGRDENGNDIMEPRYFLATEEDAAAVFEQKVLRGEETLVGNVVDLDRIREEEEKAKYPTLIPERIKKINEASMREFGTDTILTPQQNTAVVTKTKQLLERATVRMRVSDYTIMDIISSKRFKNQLETRTSSGTLNKQLRIHASGFLFGISSPGELKPREHERYGYIDNSSPLYDYLRNMGGLEQYGGNIVEFKPEVKERSTFLFGDSLGSSGAVAPSLVTEPMIPSIIENPALYGQDQVEIEKARVRVGANFDFADSGEIQGITELQERINTERYPEAQIHGDLTLADVQRITLGPQFRDTGEVASLLEAAEKYGFEVYKIEADEELPSRIFSESQEARYKFSLDRPKLDFSKRDTLLGRNYDEPETKIYKLTLVDGKVVYTEVEKPKRFN